MKRNLGIIPYIKKKRKNRRRREREIEEALGVYIINILRKVLKINKEKGRELRTHQDP